MKLDGLKDYLADSSNKLDTTMTLIFLFYMYLRVSYRENDSNIILPSVSEIKTIEQMTVEWFSLVILNVVIITQMVLKIWYVGSTYQDLYL